MQKIWKYPLELTDEQTIELPRNARILTVKEHPDNTLCLYAIHSEENEDSIPEKATIWIVGTGHRRNVPVKRYIDTVVTQSGYVWHVFTNARMYHDDEYSHPQLEGYDDQ